MRGSVSACILALLTVIAGPAAVAQNTDHSWSKTYQLTGRPSLSIETGDAQLEIRSCGECRAIRIEAQTTGNPLSRYKLEESQSGDHVIFRFKEKAQYGISVHVGWYTHHAKVSVETPAELALDAKTEDGNVEVSGLRGEIRFHSGDGHLDLRDLGGLLSLKSGDGPVHIRNFNGKLDATVSDGGVTADGVFAGLYVHSTDGNVDLTARSLSHVEIPWNIKTADGGVVLRVPKDLAADFEVHTSDGAVHSSLPLTLNSYDSNKNDLHGRMNGGSGSITIRTADGNVRLETD